MEKQAVKRTEAALYHFPFDCIDLSYHIKIPPIDQERVDGGEEISTTERHVLLNEEKLERVTRIRRAYRHLSAEEKAVCKNEYEWDGPVPKPKWRKLTGYTRATYGRIKQRVINKMARALGYL